jgi:hypothetical protein
VKGLNISYAITYSWNITSSNNNTLQLLVTASVAPSLPILVTLMMEVIIPRRHWFLQEPHGVRSQKMAFFKPERVHCWNADVSCTRIARNKHDTASEVTSYLVHSVSLLNKTIKVSKCWWHPQHNYYPQLLVWKTCISDQQSHLGSALTVMYMGPTLYLNLETCVAQFSGIGGQSAIFSDSLNTSWVVQG